MVYSSLYESMLQVVVLGHRRAGESRRRIPVRKRDFGLLLGRDDTQTNQRASKINSCKYICYFDEPRRSIHRLKQVSLPSSSIPIYIIRLLHLLTLLPRPLHPPLSGRFDLLLLGLLASAQTVRQRIHLPLHTSRQDASAKNHMPVSSKSQTPL